MIRVTLTWMLLLFLMSCGAPTWFSITQEVALADQSLADGEAPEAAAQYQAAARALDEWLATHEGQALLPDLEEERVRLGPWTLREFRLMVLPWSRILARAADDPLAAAFADALRSESCGGRYDACFDVALEFARAGRHAEARQIFYAVMKETKDCRIDADLDPFPHKFVELVCLLDDEEDVLSSFLQPYSPPRCPNHVSMDGRWKLEQIGQIARVLARYGRCGRIPPLVGCIEAELEADRLLQLGQSMGDQDEDGPPPRTFLLLDLLEELSGLCREAGDIDGARDLLDEAVVLAEAGGDEALLDLGEAYIEVGLPGEAAALAGSVDDPRIREQLLLASAEAWNPEASAGISAPLRQDVILWLEHAEATAEKARPIPTAQAFLLEIADRWEALGELERAAAARAKASDLNLQLDL